MRTERWLALNRPTSSDISQRYKLDASKSGGVSSEPAKTDTAQSSAKKVEETEKVENVVPFCPLCGAPLVMRTARYGQHKGERFWGCSMYGKTRCRGIVSLR